jgi:hypothetical protein
VQTAVTTAAVPERDGLGRLRHVTSLGDRSLVTVEGPVGPHDLVVPTAPDRAAAVAAAAGLWRLQWVRIDLGGGLPTARLAGTTRHPHVRAIPVCAALALAEQGVPAFVVEGD